MSSGSYITTDGTYSYQVAILCPSIMCSGVLVTVKAAITTASCVSNLAPSDVILYLGSIRYYTGGLNKIASSINIHSKYDKISLAYNIAVLGFPQLSSTELSSYRIATIPLCASLPAQGSAVTVTAYGAEAIDPILPPTLKKATILMYTDVQCQSYKTKVLAASDFCAGDPAGAKDLCQADQGAPLTYNNAVCGIYSWGCSCGLASPNPSSPVFIDFVFLKSWITTALAAA